MLLSAPAGRIEKKTREPPRMRSGQIGIGTRRINYQLCGPDGGETITLVNGLTQSTGLWKPYLDHFTSRGYRVLAYDMLGQGASSKPVLGVTLDDHVETLGALLDELDIGHTHLAGISFGGVIALRFAIAETDRVQSLVAMSTFSEMTPQLELLGQAMWEGMLEAGLPLLQSLLLPMNFSSAWLAANREALSELKRRGYVLNDLYAIQNLIECLADFKPFSAELDRIACPTLILNGEWDYLTPRCCHEVLRRGIRRSWLVIIQHAYHAFTLEFPAITARVIEEFLRAVADGAWIGDQSVWIAADDPTAKQWATPCRGDHTRSIPLSSLPMGDENAA